MKDAGIFLLAFLIPKFLIGYFGWEFGGGDSGNLIRISVNIVIAIVLAGLIEAAFDGISERYKRFDRTKRTA